MKKHVAIAITLVFASGIFQKASSTCGVDRAMIHINGIQTSRSNARDNMRALSSSYGPTYAGQTITYDYAYNNSNGSLWSSLAEVYFQKDVEADPDLAAAVAYGILTGDISKITISSLQASLKSDYQNLIAQNSTALAVATKTQTMVAKINTYLNAGADVVLVPHSQGCLYANSIFATIFSGSAGGNTRNGSVASSSRLKIVAVGDPASGIAGDPSNTSYVTAAEDGIINALRVQSFFNSWTLLPSNVNALSLGQDPVDGTGHSFIQTYLNPSYNAWPKIKNAIDSAMAGLQPVGKAMVSGIWDPQATGVEFHMLVNGLDVYSTYGTDQNLSQGAGWANYCMPLSPTTPTTYAPVVYNRGGVAQAVTVAGPLGVQNTTVSAQTGIFPGMFFGAVMLVQNGTVLPYI